MAWAGPLALSALSGVLLLLARWLRDRLDTQDANTHRIEHMLATELRGLDVRLSVVEAQLAAVRK